MSAMPAARLTELGSLAPPGALAAIARVKRIEPLVARSCGTARRVSRTAAISFSCRSDSHAASSTASIEPADERPALCTTPSMRPQRAITTSTSASRSSWAAHIRTLGQDLAAARFLHHPRGGTEPFLVAATDGDRCALLGQAGGQREAEPVRATGDHHDLAAELEIHVTPPSGARRCEAVRVLFRSPSTRR